MVYNEDGLTGR